MILFCDFDGTLHRAGMDDEFDQNLDAIKRWREAGNIFVLITGRGLASVKRGFPQFAEYTDYLICDNGSVCYGKNGALFEYCFGREVVDKVVSYVQSLPEGKEVEYICYSDGEEFSEAKDKQTKLRLCTRENDLADKIWKKLEEHFQGLSGVRFYPGHNIIPPRTPFIKYEHHSLVDVAPEGAGKEKALGRLAALFPDEPYYVVGDGFNDYDMLAAYNGFVMDSARPEMVEKFKEDHRVPTVSALIKRLMGNNFSAEQLIIIKDIERQLGCRVRDLKLTYYLGGATDATVFSLGEKYLVKITDHETVRTQKLFLSAVPEGRFQKLLCSNESLGYECFEFIKGEHYSDAPLEAHEVIEQIAEIVRQYPEYEHDGYGFLGEEKSTWREFLLDEIEYAVLRIKEVSQDKVMKALEAVGNYAPKQYLMHGDFGAHNFLVSDGKIRVIDPMPVVGDRLYDFFFAILSDTDIFAELGVDYYMDNFFDGYRPDYMKALLVIALYVRMSRAAVYDRDNLDKYKKLYAEI